MFTMIVRFWSGEKSEFLCDSIHKGHEKLKTLRGYKNYRFVKL